MAELRPQIAERASVKVSFMPLGVLYLKAPHPSRTALAQGTKRDSASLRNGRPGFLGSLTKGHHLTPTPLSFWVYLGGEKRRSLPAQSLQVDGSSREVSLQLFQIAGWLSIITFQLHPCPPSLIANPCQSFHFLHCVSFPPPSLASTNTLCWQQKVILAGGFEGLRVVFKTGHATVVSMVLLDLVKSNH